MDFGFDSQMKSTFEKETRVIYSITGAGADQEPIGLFIIDASSGILSVTKPLDREDRATYLVTVLSFLQDYLCWQSYCHIEKMN